HTAGRACGIASANPPTHARLMGPNAPSGSSFQVPPALQCPRLRSARRPVEQLDGVDDRDLGYQFELGHTTEVTSGNHDGRDLRNVCCFSLRESTSNCRLEHV